MKRAKGLRSVVASEVKALAEQTINATEEIMSSIPDAATGTTEVASMTEVMRGTADQTGTTSEEILHNSSELSNQRIELQKNIQKF